MDIYFAQILYETGVDSKKALARQHSDLERFKAFSKEGKVVLPSRLIFQDPASMDKVVMELAHVIHPELFPAVPEKYFKQLPDE